MKRSIFITALLMFLSLAGLQAQSIQDGIKAMDRLELEKAKGIFNSLIQKDASKATPYYYLGHIYIQNSKYDSAKQIFNKGLQANANDPLIHVGMGRYYLYDDKKAEARKEFDKALELSGRKDPYIKQQIADAYVEIFSTADGEYAANLAKEAVDKEPKNISYLLTYGDALRLKGEGGQGLSTYEKAAEMDPKNLAAPLRIGDFYMKLNNNDAAKREYDKAAAIDPNYPPVHRRYVDYYYNTGQLSKAIESYDKFLSLVGNSPIERIRYAGFLFFAKKYEEALQQLDIARKLEPEHVLLLRLTGYANEELGNHEKSSEALKKFFENAKPASIIGKDYIYYGKALSKTGQDSLALVNLEKGLETDTTDLELYNEVADVMSKLKKYDEAAALMEKKLQKSVNSINAQDYYTWGIFLYNAKNYEKADSAFKMVTQYYPTWAPGFSLRAKTQAIMDEEKKEGSAIPHYEKLIEVAGADSTKNQRYILEGLNYIGAYYYNKQDYKNARLFYQKSLAIDPNQKTAKDIVDFIEAKKKAGQCKGC